MKRVGKTLLLLVISTFIFGLLIMPVNAATTFRDIQGHWAQREIENLAAQGIVNGYPDGTFQPDRAVTRAEFATLMVNAMKLSLINPSAPSFPDVPRGMWCYQQVETAAAYKIVVGWDGRFYPQYGITHEQAATMLVNALGKAQEAEQYAQTATTFKDDAGISSWARGSVVEASRLGLITAYSDGSFRPQAVTTRAEMAVFLTRFLALYGTTPSQVSAPTLLSASYDSRDNLLTLTFDRTISVSSVDVTKIGIRFNNQTSVYFLDSRSDLRTAVNSKALQIDVVGLPEPASVQTAGIILNPGAVRDLNGIANGQISQFLQYIWYTDTTKPELEWVTYDRYDNELSLGFSEEVMTDSVDLDNIKLYRLDSDGDVSIILQDLDGGQVVSPSGDYGDTVTIELSSSDAYTLEYYLDRDEVYLVCSGVEDRNGVEMDPLDADDEEGVEIDESGDTGGDLVLKSGSYDEDSDRLTLNFNRTVDHDTVRLDRIALRFNSSSNSFYYLDEDDCEVLNTGDSSKITIEVDEDRVNEPGDVDKAWVKLSSNAVKDLSGEGNQAVTMSLDVDSDEEDDLPNLEDDGAVYDPESNVLYLSFEKRVKSIDLAEVKLWAEKSNGDVKWVIPLDNCISWDYDSNRDQIHFHLTDDDAYWIEHERQVWVRVEAGAVLDYDGNRSEQQDVEVEFRGSVESAVGIEEAVIVDYSDDYEWGDGDYIYVTFSDPIQVSGLDIDDFALTDENGGNSEAGEDAFGRGAEVAKTGGDTIAIYLGDRCGITPEKLYAGLYLKYSGDSIYDTAGHEVSASTCLIEGYDNSGPEIDDIKLTDGDSDDKIDEGDEILLYFDEPVWVAGEDEKSVRLYDEDGKFVDAVFTDVEDIDQEYGTDTVTLEVTGDNYLEPSDWWFNEMEIRFTQNEGNMVIIDVYGNPTPKRQSFSLWW